MLSPPLATPTAHPETALRLVPQVPDEVGDMMPTNFGSAADRMGLGNDFYKGRLQKWDASAKPPEGAMSAYPK